MSEPLTFVSWLWQSSVGRTLYSPEHVYALRDMVRRFYGQPHRFVCMTDRPKSLSGVEAIELWEDCAGIPAPTGRSYPSCYRRLKAFAPDAGKIFGERLVSIDLDTVIVSNIEPLFETDVEFKIWGESDYPGKQWFNGSLWMLKTGSRPQVWTQFDPERSPAIAQKAGARGSDQGWLSYILGPNEAMWGRADGVYSFRKHIYPAGGALPKDVKLVAFHGRFKPWGYECQKFGWIREFYPAVGVSA